MGDLGVLLHELLLVLLHIVKCAVVSLTEAMLGAEDEATLAWHLHESHFLGAVPALVQVSLGLFGKSPG